MRKLKWDFMNTLDEWHSFVIGWCEVLCIWPPQHPEPSHLLDAALRSEHHYYLFGRAIGVLTWLGIGFCIWRFLI